MATKQRTYTCYVSGCNEPSKGVGYSCEKHQAEHRAQWKAEHTRNGSTDTRTGWLIGDLCTVTLRKVKYDARILDMSDRADGDYLWTKLELTNTVQGLLNAPLTATWTHPEPVQSYKLRKRA